MVAVKKPKRHLVRPISVEEWGDKDVRGAYRDGHVLAKVPDRIGGQVKVAPARKRAPSAPSRNGT